VAFAARSSCVVYSVCSHSLIVERYTACREKKLFPGLTLALAAEPSHWLQQLLLLLLGALATVLPGA